MRYVLTTFFVFCLLALASGCGGASKSLAGGGNGPSPNNMGAAQEKTPDGLISEKSDLNGDGKIDVVVFSTEVKEKGNKILKIPVRKEIDLNGDGRVDVTQYFDERGDITKEELDLDFDGRVDKIVKYQKGKIESEELSSLFDGKFDVRRYFEDGVLVLKQIDTKRTGIFDEFQYYLGNKLARIGWDRDGDGKPEIFEENPAVE